MLTTIAFILLLGIIVFIHELGHFTSAKLCGMRVEIFSLGFGKALLKKKYRETEYRIAWIPLGGFVKISGMMDESMDNKSVKGEPYEFESKNFFQKSFVILAGVMMNFLLAVTIYSVITFFNGIPEVHSTHIKGFSDNSPAKTAGFMIGDSIKAIDNVEVKNWSEITEIVHGKPDTELEFRVTRADSTLLIRVKTIGIKTLYEGEVKNIGLIGIFSETVIRDAGFFESVKEGSQATWNWLKVGWLSVKMLVTGEASIKELGGPLLIAQMTGESAKAGIWAYLAFIAFISVNVGFLNVLPVPILDGGHFMFILYEGITRRRIPQNIKFRILQVGMMILFLLMVIVIINDTGRIFSSGSPEEPQTEIKKE